MRELQRHYREGGNILDYLRGLEDGIGNSGAAVLAAYDLQAGSYVAAMADPGHRAVVEAYAGAIARLFDRLRRRESCSRPAS